MIQTGCFAKSGCFHKWYSSPQCSLDTNPDLPTLCGLEVGSWVPNFHTNKMLLTFGANSPRFLKKYSDLRIYIEEISLCSLNKKTVY